MVIRKARAVWEGDLKQGQGTIALGESGSQLPYDFSGRFEDGSGSNPEELIGGAHAGCFSMALAHQLAEAGYSPGRIETRARVHLEKRNDGFVIPRIDLETEADVPGIDNESFQRLAQDAERTCPVSKVLVGADIALTAKLLREQGA